jgi:OmpA-OmpF porin, OOP family
MKAISTTPALLLVALFTQAQVVSVTKAVGSAVTNQTNNTIYNTTNQGVSSVFNAPGKIFRKIKSKSSSNSSSTNSTTVNNSSGSSTVSTNNQDSNSANKNQPDNSGIAKAGSSDFVAGTEILFSDNFSSTNVGEFPGNWITNSSGEVRTVEGQEGNWLQISANGIFALGELADLPDNFTVEYDAIFHPTPSKDVHYIFYLYSQREKVADFKETSYPGKSGIYLAFNTAGGEVDAENFENGKAGIIDSHLVTDLLKSALANKVHVGIWRQKSKLTLYINGSKVFSSPNALPANYTYNGIKFGSFFMGSDDFMLLSNLTIATN